MHASMLNPVNLALAASLVSPAVAFWRMACPSRLIQERIDPLIFPGEVSAHVHIVAGGSGFGFNMSYEQARASSCSSCPITADLSNYWTPQLYYQAQNGSFTKVPIAGDGNGNTGGMTVYYLQRPGPNNDVLKAFPKGFRMIAGNPFQRNYTGTFAAQGVSFHCLNYNAAAIPETNGLPNQVCPDGVRAQVFFPSCWDGKNLDSPDHSSHMAYPISGAYNDGVCPSTHPVHMISLFYEVVYSTGPFTWYSNNQPFVFANGDPTGYGFHGDFINGWDVDILQKAVTNCNADSGNIQDCPYFNFFTNQQCADCNLPTYVQEDVNGPMAALPGCNPVQAVPGLATNYYATCGKKQVIALQTNYFVDVTKTLGYQYIGCGNDSVSAGRTFTGASTTSSTMTVQQCVSFCSAKGFAYAGVEYASECYCGNTLPASRAPQKGYVSGGCSMTCAGNSTQYCGGPGAMSMYQKCSGAECKNNVYIPAGPVPIPEP